MIPFLTVLLMSNLGQASLFDDLSIAWSGLTQNTLDLGILDTDLTPEIAISWSVLDCYHPFLLGWHDIILQTV